MVSARNRLSRRRHARNIASRRIGGLHRRIGVLERLEPRLTLSATSFDGRPFIDVGPSDNVAWDQPRVNVQFLTEDFPAGTDPDSSIIVGPNTFNSWLLDTGANTTLAFKTAIDDMLEFPPYYETNGQFEELGVGGVELFDVSVPYRFDYSGSSNFERNTILDKRIISNHERDLSIFGPWGIVGMPAMTEKVTTLDFTPWTDVSGFDLFMLTDFFDEIPEPAGPRYTLEVDNRVNFSPDGSAVPPGGPVPAWADLPFFGAELRNNESYAGGNFLFDTGAQVSIISSSLAFGLGLDSNGDGVLNALDANFARTETIGGISGTTQVPVFLIDEVHIPTAQGPDLVWTDLQWVVLDIIDSIDGVFGFDNMTSGWIEAFAVNGQSGYTMKSHLDFRGWEASGKGDIHFDFNEDYFTLIDPSGPGAVIEESGGTTVVTENNVATDTYEIRLTQPPTANVTVTFVGGNGQVEAVDSSNPNNGFVTFTPQNWNVPQTVIVRGVNDATVEGYQRGFLRNVSSSTDPDYDGVGMPRLTVGIVDDDFAGMMILPTDGETVVTEGGPSDYYDIVLMTQPTEDVFIVMDHAANQIEVASDATSSSLLVFDSSNWNIPQRVRVTANDDAVEEAPLLPAYINHIIGSTDEEYSQAFGIPEKAFVRDDDSSDASGPRITDVIVGSSGWSAAFVDTVDGGGAGSGNGLGVSLLGANQLDNLPWTQVDRIYIQFDDDVSGDFSTTNVSLTGVNTVDYAGSFSTGFGQDGVNIGTLFLSEPLANDIVRIDISDALRDGAGNVLDGEWIDGVTTLSGDGNNGGSFQFRIDALPGDVNDNGGVSFADVFQAYFANGQTTTVDNFRLDVNGNGAVNFADVFAILALNGTTLPNPPSGLLGSGGTSGGGGKALTALLEGYGGVAQAVAVDAEIPARLDRVNPFLRRAMQHARELSLGESTVEASTETIDTAASTRSKNGQWLAANAAVPPITVQDRAILSLVSADRQPAELTLRSSSDRSSAQVQLGIVQSHESVLIEPKLIAAKPGAFERTNEAGEPSAGDRITTEPDDLSPEASQPNRVKAGLLTGDTLSR